MKPVAVLLSGCGVIDGSEITEAAGLIIALSQAGFPVRFFAPDRAQHDVFDHARHLPSEASRNILAESARIARGNIQPLSALKEGEICAVALPGGMGAAKNLTDFASQGTSAKLAQDVSQALIPMIGVKKPLLALCAAPLVLGLLARDAGIRGARITFGHQAEGAEMIHALHEWGQTHVETPVDVACIDLEHRMISVPAYMYGEATPAQIFAGCQAGVTALTRLLMASGAA
jgi:enhancing lycopene biosynthesis protein 2